MIFGFLPGIMKLLGEGGTPKAFVMLGAEKSSLRKNSKIQSYEKENRRREEAR
jgi:hypothetical protein